MSMLGDVIAELQSLGLRMTRDDPQRKGGAGPAEGGVLFIEGRAVNLPTQSPFVQDSPYRLASDQEQLVLLKGDKALFPVETSRPPLFYRQATADGISFQQIALMHGADCLATTVLQKCLFWNTSARCRFCGIEVSLNGGRTIAVKTPEQVAEVAAYAKEHDGIRHVVLTTGTASPIGAEIDHLASCARAVKRAAGLPVHAQCLPLRPRESLPRLKEAGVDTVGIHIESMEQEVLAKVAPVKAALGRSRFIRAWQEAVRVFGPNQVSSFLLAGLGETWESLRQGALLMADLGVYPFLVPLRPIPGSRMEKALPPPPEDMKRLYREVAALLACKGLSASKSMAGCVRCGACSALPAYEGDTARLVCHPARTRQELAAARDIRWRVFVEEQGVNPAAERDADDGRSIHLVACLGGRVVGTVRVYPMGDTDGHWVGGRLAVDKEHRGRGTAELLVKEAMRAVKRRGCRRFTASVQRQNVPFFRRLGWRSLGRPDFHHGIAHQTMQADLEKV